MKSLKKLALLLLFALPGMIGNAQPNTITGKIIAAETGEPLPNVSITLKNKSGGTSSGSTGEFSIQAATGDVLVFSHTGYQSQEITVGSSFALEISMQANAGTMGEVVVIGYGTQSRRNVTSSIAKLDGRVLENAPRSNIGQALQGTLPGLRVVNTTGSPGSTPQILLRGGASINNPGEPLVVVDGVVRAFNDIPADDIASVELLKDAASTAIYGARANNGVILITTKQGKAGTARVTYKFTGGLNVRREGYSYLNAKEFIYYNRLGNLNSGRTLAQVNSARGYGLLTDAANLALFDIRTYNSSTQHLLNSGWDTIGDPYGGTIIFKDHSGEIEDLVFRNTKTRDHYINVSGGNEKSKYFASFDYYDEEGTVVGSSYRRYSGNLNGSFKIKPNLEVTTGAVLSTSSQLGTVNLETSTHYRTLAIWPTMNPWLDSAKTQPNPGAAATDGNPLYWLGKLKRDNQVNRISANAAVKYDILKNLFVRVSGNGYLVENLNRSFQQATQFYTNLYTNPPSFNNSSRNSISTFTRSFQQQYNGIINYSTSINNHNIDAMLGAEYFTSKSFGMQVYGQNAPTDDIPTANASTTFPAANNYSNESQYSIASHFGRLNYNYDQRYLLSLVYRQDGVSRLAEENRYGFFPGMSAGWNVHNEKFFENSFLSPLVSTLKARISYGVNGNIAGIGNYDVQGTYGNVGIYNGSSGFLNTGIINSGLRWEKSTTTDIGLDVGILKNRVTVLFDYFNRRTSDLLTDLSLPSYLGFSSVMTNLGEFQNKGFEVAVNANILNNPKGLSWNLSANTSFVKNKILKLPFNGNENNRQGGFQVFDPASGKVIWVGGLQEGQPLGAIYAFRQVSIFRDEAELARIAGTRVDIVANISGPNVTYGTGKITPGDVNWLDVDKNDTIDSRDQVYMGNYNPKFTGGFSNTLSFKGFSLFTRFEFALGHVVYNDLLARTMGNFNGTFNYIDLIKEAWTPENPDTDIPKVYYADQVAAPLGKKNYTRINNAAARVNGNNSQFYEKGDYLACREITLSYDFSKNILSRTRFLSAARAYININNLFYLTKFRGPSPEPPSDGVYQGVYVLPKSFVVGLQITL